MNRNNAEVTAGISPNRGTRRTSGPAGRRGTQRRRGVAGRRCRRDRPRGRRHRSRCDRVGTGHRPIHAGADLDHGHQRGNRIQRALRADHRGCVGENHCGQSDRNVPLEPGRYSGYGDVGLGSYHHDLVVQCPIRCAGSIIDTPMARNGAAEGNIDPDLLAGMTPVRRNGTPDDVAATRAFLCSDNTGFSTGQTVGVNGGWYLQDPAPPSRGRRRDSP